MKNKFKKSKIIVPALALITATTVASVTGTVAWFTASRAVTVQASTFTSTTEGASLIVTSEAILDCGVTAGDNGSATFDGLLTHGSYNAQKITSESQGNLYSPIIDDANANVTGYNDLGTVASHLEQGTTSGQGTTPQNNKWISGTKKISTQQDSSTTTTTKNVWYGVAWKLKFTQANTNSNITNNLLVDLGNCSFTDSATSGDSTTHTIQGFRIALMTSTNCVVLGGDDCKEHVTSTNSTNKTGENAPEAFGEGVTYHKVKVGNTDVDTYTAATDSTSTENNASAVTNNSGYLGTLNDNGTTATEVTCVAWFEGCDTDHIVNQVNNADVVMSTVSASMKFYSRKTVNQAGN